MLELKCFLGDLDNLYLLRSGKKYILIPPSSLHRVILATADSFGQATGKVSLVQVLM